MSSNAPRPIDASSSPIDLDLLPDEHTRRFVVDLIERHRYHTKLAADLNRRYKRWSPILLVFIPIYSAVLSFLTTGIIPTKVLGGLALILTVATILNSIVKPDEKFVTSAFVLVQLKDWEADFALSLSEIDMQDRKELGTFLRRKNVELSEVGNSMAKTYLPQKNN